MIEEKLAENAFAMGAYFRSEVQKMVNEFEHLTLVRGKGLLNAIVIKPAKSGKTAWDVCVALKENGMLAKPTHGDIIRFAPPLVITKDEIDLAVSIIRKVLKDFN